MITCPEHTYFTCWRQQPIFIYVWCISVDIWSDLLVADRPNKAIALSWSLIPHTSLNKWWLPWHVMTIRRQLLAPFPRPKFAGCNAAWIQKQGKCWSQERCFIQGSDFINHEEKTGVFWWVVAAMLVGILTKDVLFPWCPPMAPTSGVSWGKHWGAVVTPAASSRSTQEFNSKALPQGGLMVHQLLAKSILRLH